MTEEGFLRSEKMSLIQLYIPFENGHQCMTQIGEFGMIEFRDLNPQVNPLQRAFTGTLAQLDEMVNRVRFLMDESKKRGIQISLVSKETEKHLLGTHISRKMLDDMAAKLVEDEERVLRMKAAEDSLLTKWKELREKRFVVEYMRDLGVTGSADTMLSQVRAAQVSSNWSSKTDDDSSQSPLLHDSRRMTTESLINAEAGIHDSRVDGDFGVLMGVIPATRQGLLESVLWRALRGNLYILIKPVDKSRISPIFENSSKDSPAISDDALCVFMASAHGRHLLLKIKQLSEALGARLYDDVTADDLSTLTLSFHDLENVLMSTLNAQRHELERISEYLPAWYWTLLKEKRIYHTLNLCSLDATRKCLLAEGWSLTAQLPQLQSLLRALDLGAILNEIPFCPSTEGHGNPALMPPTYHPTNKFTSCIQSIVDAYGVGRYQELNPALFSLVTFPFLFAVMFGDFGHGLFLAVTGCILCKYEKKIFAWMSSQVEQNEVMSMLFNARYVVLLMGIFSIYMGLIYNDLFSRGMELFPSSFQFYRNGTLSSYDGEYVYPIGMDWSWVGAENVLLFTNSYKMKQALLFGILHMLFGILLFGWNSHLQEDYLSFWTLFIPQIVFMLAIFGYLAFIIVYKWCTQSVSHAPSILTMLIQMMMSPGKVADADRFLPGQEYIQMILLLLAFLCIPVLFFGTPLVKNHYRKKAQKTMHDFPVHVMVTEATPSPSMSQKGAFSSHGKQISPSADEEEEDNIVVDFVHNGIHTIEFLLGAISNTASYLRLWALSLAHSQLSDVLWTMIIEFFGSSFIIAFLFFPLWLGFTVSILVMMEGLSAFLHALRLHWVEFNNKFYKGDGRHFFPFCYRNIYQQECQD